MELDIVYTYVNNTDKQWYNKIKKYKNDIDPGRFNFQGEIFYSLKTLNEFFPHIRKIFIVHDNQKFDLSYLPTDFSNKIHFIDHTEIIPAKYLPTFSSLVIETFLWRIPNLNDYFVYFNDDMFVGNYLLDCDFFTEDRKFKVFVKQRKVNKSNNKPWKNFIHNAQILFEKKFNKPMHYDIGHICYNLNKYVCEFTWNIFKNEIEPNLIHKFRDPNDINFVILSQMVGINFNIFVPITKYSYEFVRKLDDQMINKLIKDKPKFIIMNELFDIHKPYWNKFQNIYLKQFSMNNYKMFINMLRNKKLISH